MILDKTYEQALTVFNNRCDSIDSLFIKEMNDIDNAINEGYYIEAVSDNIMDNLKAWFANIITEIRRFISDIKNGFMHEAKDLGYSVRLSSMETELKKMKKEGKKEVKMTDYKTLQKEYLKYRNEIKSYATKFVKLKYKSTLDFDDDMKKFEDICEKYDKRLDEIAKNKITVSIDEALRFVESEKTGNSLVIDNLNDLSKDVSDIRDIASNALTSESLIGSSALNKRDNRSEAQKLKDASHHVKTNVSVGIHRATNGLCKFTRKHVSRMMFKVVLFTA